MSYQIITRITITPDLRVMVRMAANNIRPLDFRYDEVVSQIGRASCRERV